jgi:hypothetical protein
MSSDADQLEAAADQAVGLYPSAADTLQSAIFHSSDAPSSKSDRRKASRHRSRPVRAERWSAAFAYTGTGTAFKGDRGANED